MIASLVSLAEREGLLDDLASESRDVHWVVELGVGGRFLGLISLASPQPGKTRPVGLRLTVPMQGVRTSGVRPFFLVDKLTYVFGELVAPRLLVASKSDARLREMRAAFRALVSDAAAATAHPALAAVLAFLCNDAALGQAVASFVERVAEGEHVAFRYIDAEGEDVGFVHHLAPVSRWWMARWYAQQAPPADASPCLVCGAATKAQPHRQIKYLPGEAGGVALVSAKDPAFWSYGWEGPDNAPMCVRCAEGYSRALNRLLDPSPRVRGEATWRGSIRLSDDTAAVFWSAAPRATMDWFSALFEAPSPQNVHRLLASAFRGSVGGIDEHDDFSAIVLSTTKGRARVRSRLSQTLSQLTARLSTYCADLRVDGWDRSLGTLPPGARLGLTQLMRSLAVGEKDANVAPGLADGVFAAAMTGAPLPLGVLAAAVQRSRAERDVTTSRAAILLAYFRRRRRAGDPIPDFTESVMTLSTTAAPGYRLGRVLALLEHLQLKAVRPSATLVDRFYKGASTSPVTAFPRLLASSKSHIAKLGATGRFFDRRIAEILTHGDGLPSFPATLSLAEQGQFALGYYQERQWIYTPRAPVAPAGAALLASEPVPAVA
jgi:CRISPR-associated protein Csd1